jgi:hypothetical protein
VIGHARVVVLDRGGEEIEKAARSPASAIIDGTISELRNVGAVTGAP